MFFFCKGHPYRREVHYHGLGHQDSKWPDKHYMQVIWFFWEGKSVVVSNAKAANSGRAKPISERIASFRWPDLYFFQLSRSLSDFESASSIYPWPRKLLAPNDNDSIENTTTNIVQNKERSLLETTYQADYSTGDGLGSHVTYDTTAKLLPTEKLVSFFFV